jgi:glycosyltransferase involved in cell wall biosynthesis
MSLTLIDSRMTAVPIGDLLQLRRWDFFSATTLRAVLEIANRRPNLTMKILFLPRYGTQGASSRYRISQYVPLFEAAGHETQVLPLLEDGYLRELYATGRRGWRWLVSGYAKRLEATAKARHFDLVICEQEVLPLLPTLADRTLLAFNHRLIVDYDDATYFKYERWPWLRNKIPRLIASAAAVVVGNNHLAQYAHQFTRNVFVIPTVVDITHYPEREQPKNSGEVRIVWIGTPLTASFLNPLRPVMARLQQTHSDLIFRFIGAGESFPSDGLRAECVEWSERTETDMLAACDIGIMFLPDNEFTRAKCGLKLIRYMACSLPVVASPVGANREIVTENQNGFLANSDEEWFQNLDLLVRNAQLRRRLGKFGRGMVAERYSLTHGFALWLEVMRVTVAEKMLPPFTC